MSSSVPVSRAGYRRSQTIKVAREKNHSDNFLILLCSFMHVFFTFFAFLILFWAFKQTLTSKKIHKWVFQPRFSYFHENDFLQSDAIPDHFYSTILFNFSVFFLQGCSRYSLAAHRGRAGSIHALTCIFKLHFGDIFSMHLFFFINELYFRDSFLYFMRKNKKG